MSIRNRLAHNPIYIWLSHASYRLGTLISPDWTSRRRFQKTFGFALREDAPVWWSEKLMLLKMRDYNRSPLVRQCANKYAVRDYVRKCGCGELLLETYGVWDNANDIPFDELPPDCILKTTMGCGLQNHVIIRNGQLPDHAAAVRTLQSALHDRYYLDYAEMQYAPGSDYKPQIYCERLVSSPAGAMPPDYKVYCFHGEPHYVLYCYNRSTHDGHAEFMLLNANGQPQPALFPSNAENATPPPICISGKNVSLCADSFQAVPVCTRGLLYGKRPTADRRNDLYTEGVPQHQHDRARSSRIGKTVMKKERPAFTVASALPKEGVSREPSTHAAPTKSAACYNRSGADGHADYMFMNTDWLPQPALHPCTAMDNPPPRPKCLDKLYDYARVLSQPFPFVRVDFYVEHDRPLIGEMTFTPSACLDTDLTELGQVELGKLL